MGSVILKFIAGAAVGLFTGVVTESFAPQAINAPGWDRWEQIVLLMFGGLLGAVVGGLDGLSRGGAVWIWRGLGIAALLGVIGATFGAGLGGGIANGIFGPTWENTGALPIRMVGRTLVFVGIGAFVGAGIGGASLNVRKLVQGATGGLLGGAAAGVVFDPLGTVLAPTILAMRGQTSGEVGGPSRMIAWVVLGAMVALMIGLVERLTRKAWLRADFGRNEFKEWPLDAAQNFVGRGETCHVILRGDPQIAPVHASITKQGSQYVVADAGTPVGTFVNGHRIAQASLNAGDVVQIGSFALRFMVKSAQAAYAPHMQAAPQPGPGPMPGPMQPPMGIPTPGMPPPGYGMPAQAMPPPGYGAPTQAMTPLYGPTPGQPTVAFPAGGAMGSTLVALDGPHTGRRFPVGGVLEIGREASGIALTGDANASRRHASVAPGPGGLQVTDLGSTNGTYVDGARIQSAIARPGSTVRVGGTTFRVE